MHKMKKNNQNKQRADKARMIMPRKLKVDPFLKSFRPFGRKIITIKLSIIIKIISTANHKAMIRLQTDFDLQTK